MTEYLGELLREGGAVAVPVAFLAGVVASVNPCCLPIYPAATGCCTALRRPTLRGNLGLSAAFVLGGSAATTTLGTAAAVAGRVFTALGSWPVYLLAAVPLLFGLHVLGVIKLPLPTVGPATRAGGGIAGAAGAGALLGLTIAPCATPVLAGLLTYVATKGDPAWGALVLFFYGLGLGIPVLVLGTTAASLVSRLASERARRWVDSITGAVLIGVGLYLVWLA